MEKRYNYIDNLRFILVFLIVIYHIAMAFNTWCEANYIFIEESKPLSSIIVFLSPYYMPILFLLAGISSYYSLKKRGYKTFIKERLLRLGIPLIFSILVIVPILSYIADIFHNSYNDNFFMHYSIFFTKYTDFTGYDGGFSFGHLWFILVLLLISIITLIPIRITELIKNQKIRKISLIIFSILSIIIMILTFDVKLLGKPLIVYLFIYLLGYFVFSKEEIINKISKFWFIYLPIFLISAITNVVLFIWVKDYEILNNISNYFAFIFGVISLISIFYRFINKTNVFLKESYKISYVFYIIHFPIVVLLQYMFYKAGLNVGINVLLSIILSYILTYGLSFLISKIKYIRVLFGLK